MERPPSFIVRALMFIPAAEQLTVRIYGRFSSGNDGVKPAVKTLTLAK